MLVGELTELTQDDIKVPSGIRAALALGEDSVVHIAPVRVEDDIQFVLTTIPPSRWGFVGKIKMRLAPYAGSMFEAASALANEDINILIAEGISVDEHCAGLWTILADLSTRRPSQESEFDLAERCRTLQKTLSPKKRRPRYLSSRIDAAVEVVPLTMLPRMASCVQTSFTSIYNSGAVAIPKDLRRYWWETLKRRTAHEAFLTADSEECFCRLILPTEGCTTFRGTIESESVGLQGVGIYRDVSSLLKEHLNLRWCYNYITEMSETAERAKIQFVGEDNVKHAKPRSAVSADMIQRELKKLNLGDGKRITAASVRVMKRVRPWCFLAYSADRDPHRRVSSIKRMINRVGFDTKEGSIIAGAPIPEEVTRMVTESDCLVSCLLSSYKQTGMPSIWVLFEEVLALTRGKPVLRIRDEEQIPEPPPYERNFKESKFGKTERFADAVRDLEDRLETLLRTLYP